MKIYFEFDDSLVDKGIVPARLCVRRSKYRFDNQHMLLAERVFSVTDNTMTALKDRYSGTLGTKVITDMDKVALILTAVLI